MLSFWFVDNWILPPHTSILQSQKILFTRQNCTSPSVHAVSYFTVHWLFLKKKNKEGPCCTIVDDNSGFSWHGCSVSHVFLLQGTGTLGVFVQKGPGVKVQLGIRGSLGSLVHRVIRAQWCLSLQGNTPRFSW